MSNLPKGQVLAYDPNTVFGTTVQATNLPKNIPARVNHVDTNRIQYDPQQILGMPDHVFAHEMEHVLDARAGNRYGDVAGQKEQLMYQAYLQAGGNPEIDYQSDFRKGLAQPGVQQRLEQLGLSDGYTSGFPKDTRQGVINNAPWHELLASLSGYEQSKNIDLTQDPVLSKMLFNNPAFTAAYKASTGLRTERLDAKDLPPYTVQQPPIDIKALDRDLP